MKWEKVKLGDVCSNIISGGTPLSSREDFYYPAEIPWLKTKEVNYKRIYNVENYISEVGLNNSSAKLIPANSVIVAMYGQGDTAGRVAINKIPLCTNQACCNLIIDKYKANYNFVYYFLSNNYQKLVSLKNGGAQPNLNVGTIKEFKILLPNLETQNKIASILSSYDDLIENNQKQIKLLEETAQRLYKEWFVDLRFPGYEDVEIVDGLPKGWERCLLSEIADVRAGGDRPIEFSKVKTEMFGVPIYSNGIDEEGLYGYTDKAVVEMECVTISARGTVGVAFYRDTPFVPIVRLLTVVPTNRFDAVFLYHLLKNTTFNSNGAAQQQLTIPMLEKTEIILPSIEIAVRYSFIAKELYVQRKFLKAIINMLVEARDRLLPKLMSGEVEV